MQLNREYLDSYERDGYLFLPGLFSSSEVAILKDQLPEVFAEDSERRVVEKGSGAVRSVYGSHQVNDVFRRLTKYSVDKANLSPYDRKIVLVTYNRVDNLPREARRPEFLVSRDFTPIQPSPENALLA